MPRPRAPATPFRYFNSSPEVIGLAVLLYVKYPLSLRNVEDVLHERGIDISHETVRYWWNRFGPLFASDIRRQRVSRMRGFRQWRWHPDEMFAHADMNNVQTWPVRKDNGHSGRWRCGHAVQSMALVSRRSRRGGADQVLCAMDRRGSGTNDLVNLSMRIPRRR
jgi:putative transposase